MLVGVALVAGLSSATATAADAAPAPLVVDPNAYQPYDMAVGAGPRGMAMLSGSQPGYVANSGDGSVSVVTTCQPRSCLPGQSSRVDVGAGPAAVAVSATGSTAYVTLSGSDAVAVLAQSPTTLASAVASTIPVGSRPGDLALDPSGARRYVANNGADSVSVIDTATSTVVATVPVGSAPGDIALDPTGAFGYVTNNGSASVSVIDTTSGSVVATIPVGSQPWGIVVTADGGHAFVADYADGTTSVIDLASRTVVATIRVGANPFGVATWSPPPADAGAVYVSNSGGSTVSTIQLQAATPAPAWTVRKRTRTVTGVVPFVAAVEYGIRAVQGSRVRTGTCVRVGASAPKAACSVRLPKGTWRVSVTTRLPWQATAGGNQNRRVRF